MRLEKRHALRASRVRVVHALPPANTAYKQSLTRASHREAGANVDEVWTRLLRDPDSSYKRLDPARLPRPRGHLGGVRAPVLVGMRDRGDRNPGRKGE